MSKQVLASSGAEEKNCGWRVTMAGLGINLALGILYTWSIISGQIDNAGWGWTSAQRALPYSVACLVFCLIMVPAGRMQDRMGPRLVASIGGILVGIGMILASRTSSVTGYVLGFGVLAGAGIGFGYASATPAAVKWFPSAKTGLIAGIVVSGFGLASVYAAPLAEHLAGKYGLQTMMMSFGMAFLIVVVGLAQLLKVPHRAQQLIKGYGKAGELQQAMAAKVKKENFSASEMLKTWQFYALWFMYACGAGAGLMIISATKKIVKGAEVGDISLFGRNVAVAVIAVSGLGIGNGAGRIVAGMLSDKIGRKATMVLFFVLQAAAIVVLSRTAVEGSRLATAGVLIGLTMLVGANYGANLSLFPSITKDFFGLKNFGLNYGLVFTAWGIGGFTLALFAAKVFDGRIVEAWKGSYSFAFYTSAALLILAAIVALTVVPPHHTTAE